MAGLKPFTRAGQYVNDVVEQGEDVVRGIYGDAKYDRLRALKRAHDPDISGVDVRRAWGHTGSAVDPLNVMEVRGLSKGRTKPWTDQELQAAGRGGRGGGGH